MISKKDISKKWRHSKHGKLASIFHAQIQRSKKNRSHINLHKVEYDFNYFFNRFIKDKKFLIIYKKWVNSNFSKYLSPSIDRINPKKGYLKNNIQITTWNINRKKGFFENRNSKKIIMNNSIVFNSLSEAAMKTDIQVTNICACLKLKRKTAGGNKWKYYDSKRS